jgi:hypothetical protein
LRSVPPSEEIEYPGKREQLAGEARDVGKRKGNRSKTAA